jgi:transcriptional regulator with XRE-family HTH domain
MKFGWRQEDLALRARARGLRWSASTVTAIEIGRRPISAGELLLLPTLLQVPLTELVSGDQDEVAEIRKIVARQRGDGDALQAVALMQQARVIDLDASLALIAAKAAIDHNLPLADSMVYATAILVEGVVWTQDDDFEDLPNVRYYPKKKRS